MASMAIRISDHMKKEMEKLKINWSHYLRQSITEALQSARKRDLITRMQKWLPSGPPSAAGTAAKIIRHQRDRG